MTLKTPSDIPSSWPIIFARKKTTVTIRPSNGVEKFQVSWQDSELISDPEKDLIIIQPNGKEYPCKKDIFAETYIHVGEGKWAKSAQSKLVRVPEGETVSIETLEGTLNAVQYPDYISIGPQGELYANTKRWADENLEIISHDC